MLKRHSLKRGMLVGALAAVPCALASSGNGPTDLPAPAIGGSYEVRLAPSHITIDGAIEEDAWQNALVLELGYETYPGENVPAQVRTECRVTYDASRLYVGFRAFDPAPQDIRARFSGRDSAYGDDWVSFLLDTFNDGRRAFAFYVNPLGVQMDAVEDEVNGYDDAWDTLWDSAARRTEVGYEVEVAVPFSSLRFPKRRGEQVSGLSATRSYPRNREYVFSVHPRSTATTTAASARPSNSKGSMASEVGCRWS